MRPRKSFAAVLLTAASFAGSVLYRRRSARRLERVELYAEDGSMTSVADGSPEAERLLGLARDVLLLAG